MGRPKIKIIDDSLPELVASDKSPAKGKARQRRQESRKAKAKTKDDLVAKINAELGITDQSSVLSDQLSEESQPVVSKPVIEKQKTEKPKSENRKLKTDNRKKPRSKKYQEAVKDLDKSKTYPLTEAIDMAKKMSYSKFNGTLEAHINTAALGIRGLVSLPFASGKKLRILAFPSTHSINTQDRTEYNRSTTHSINTQGRTEYNRSTTSLRASFKDAGELQEKGIVFGDDTTIEEINKGKIAFDLLLTTPDWMPKLAKVAKNLGPRGLMPNPKSGTIVSGEDGLKKAVESFQSGKTEYKTESKAPVIHLALGKLGQPTEELFANIKTLVQQIGKTRVKKIALSPTMGPSVKVDLSSI